MHLQHLMDGGRVSMNHAQTRGQLLRS
ncbi:uncharacterized protein METZ01_LOCUS373548 [marine metagenome]|uniref:Uncharacterized protein n=1 Tax=marine metagenome TaxID=408172 RepID=A0A382TF04_9ZZZZ